MIREIDSGKCTARIVTKIGDRPFGRAAVRCSGIGQRRCLKDACLASPLLSGAEVVYGRCRADWEETNKIFQIRKAIGALIRKPRKDITKSPDKISTGWD